MNVDPSHAGQPVTSQDPSVAHNAGESGGGLGTTIGPNILGTRH
jgi:hypothetical protein